jgi:sugar fermentation stimulation protein A
MIYPSPLIPARLLKRYKRFLADVELQDGDRLTVQCPNTGSMLGLSDTGTRIWLSEAQSAARKYRLTWELVETSGEPATLVGINPLMPNRIVGRALAEGSLPELAGYAGVRREVRYGANSRIDFLLAGHASARDCHLEIKNVHLMREAGLAEFPDCTTARGAKHLGELATIAAAGGRAVMLFLIQRGDADRLSIADDLDPAYLAAFLAARRAGVEMLAYACTVGLEDIRPARPVPILTGL